MSMIFNAFQPFFFGIIWVEKIMINQWPIMALFRLRFHASAAPEHGLHWQCTGSSRRHQLAHRWQVSPGVTRCHQVTDDPTDGTWWWVEQWSQNWHDNCCVTPGHILFHPHGNPKGLTTWFAKLAIHLAGGMICCVVLFTVIRCQRLQTLVWQRAADSEPVMKACGCCGIGMLWLWVNLYATGQYMANPDQYWRVIRVIHKYWWRLDRDWWPFACLDTLPDLEYILLQGALLCRIRFLPIHKGHS
jgi:hypothetical protein